MRGPTPTKLPRQAQAVADTLLGRLALPQEAHKYVAFASLLPGEVGEAPISAYVRACATLGGVSLRLLGLHRAMVISPGQDAKANQIRARSLRPALEDEINRVLRVRDELSPEDQTQLAQQIVGAVVRSGAYSALYDLIRDVRPSESANPTDYKTVLQEWAVERGLGEPRYETLGATGPDHDKTWRVRVHLGRLSSPEATGGTKRRAQGVAAQLLLSAAAPERLHRAVSSRVTGDLSTLRVLPEHRRQVDALVRRLRLRESWAPLVSAALVPRAHSSLSPAYRAAAGGLAQMGADALVAYAFARLIENPDNAPVEASFVARHATRRDVIVQAFADAQLDQALLLGRDAPARARPRLQSDSMQALAAIALLAHRRIDALPRLLPVLGDRIDEAISEGKQLGRRLLHDPKSVLQEICVACATEVTYELRERSGPDHDASFRALVSLAGARGVRSVVSPPAPSRREAEAAAAAEIVGSLDLPGSVWKRPTLRDVVQFLLNQLDPASIPPSKLAKLPLAPVDWVHGRRWRQLGQWLTAVERLVSPTSALAWADPLKAVAESDGPSAEAVIFGDLIYVTDVIARLTPTDPTMIRRNPVLMSRLLRLATAARVRQRPRIRRSLTAVSEDLQLLYRWRTHVTISGTWSGTIVEREGTIVALAEHTLARGDLETPWCIASTTHADNVEIRIAAAQELPAVSFSLLDAIGSDVPIIDASEDENGFRMTWLLDPGKALTRFFEDGAVPPDRSALASDLHDLKNALQAFEAVSRRTSSTATDEFARSYQASKHLDEARRLGVTLLTTSRSISPQLTPVDLAELIEEYMVDFMRRRPREVAISVGSLPPCLIPASRELIISSLDNLAKNAVEAMNGQGRIEIFLFVHEQEARIEVRDTAGGLTEQQLDIVNAGGSLPSGSQGGSGLGLLSVHRAMAAIGGHLEASRIDGGSSMTLVVPRVQA